jgi:rRNA maturation endonuclease Nob1
VDPIIAGSVMGAAIIGFLLFIRFKDLPQPAPVSPFRHLEERKAAIYESLRDLQFEYRLNKLSDQDYQTTKVELQRELAKVLAETDRIKAQTGAVAAPVTVKPAPPPVAAVVQKPVCESCGAVFEKALKFCGECGKPMGVAH